jgi:hypothetical protein
LLGYERGKLEPIAKRLEADLATSDQPYGRVRDRCGSLTGYRITELAFRGRYRARVAYEVAKICCATAAHLPAPRRTVRILRLS